MVALGLPDFGPVQNNVSFNATRGATRGIHTEPWDKFVSVATGRVFGAWVDMREGDASARRSPSRSTRRSRSSCRAASATATRRSRTRTAYTYLVNEHWRPGTAYPALDLADPTVGDRLADPARPRRRSPRRTAPTPRWPTWSPMQPKKTLIIGALASSAARCQADFPGADLVDLRPSSTSTDAGRGRGLAVARVRRGAQRRRLHRRRRRRDARRPARPPGRPTPPLRRPWPGSPREHRLHARALLHRLRLRRHRRACTPRTSRCRRSASTRQTKAAGDIAVGHRAAPLPAPHVVGDRRRQQLRAHDAEARGRRGLADASSTTRSAG